MTSHDRVVLRSPRGRNAIVAAFSAALAGLGLLLVGFAVSTPFEPLTTIAGLFLGGLFVFVFGGGALALAARVLMPVVLTIDAEGIDLPGAAMVTWSNIAALRVEGSGPAVLQPYMLVIVPVDDSLVGRTRTRRLLARVSPVLLNPVRIPANQLPISLDELFQTMARYYPVERLLAAGAADRRGRYEGGLMMFKRLKSGLMGAGRAGPIPRSIADALLQRDVMNSLTPVLRAEQDMKWRLSVQIVEPRMSAVDGPEGRWVERWSFSTEGRTATFLITFTPDGKGGTDYLIEGQPPESGPTVSQGSAVE